MLQVVNLITCFNHMLLQLLRISSYHHVFGGLEGQKYLEVLKYYRLFYCFYRTAGAIRTAALSGVQALLHSRLLSPDQIQSLLSLLLPQVVPRCYVSSDRFSKQVLSCLDDDNPSTRLVSCKVLGGLLQSAPQAHTGNGRKILRGYPRKFCYCTCILYVTINNY